MSRSVQIGTVFATMESIPEEDRHSSLDDFLRALWMCQTQPALQEARFTLGKLMEPSIPYSRVPHIRFTDRYGRRVECPEAKLVARWDGGRDE